jgi:PAS domain S-box-containing protein
MGVLFKICNIDFSRLLLVCLVLIGFAISAEAAQSPRVLVLNSYHLGYDWSDDETRGLKSELTKALPDVLLYYEYLDAKKFPRKTHFPRLAELYANKYRAMRFDAIIVMDNAALEFAMRYRLRLFRKRPIVFCGINDYAPSMLQGMMPITGVAELQDSTGTLEMALKHFPKTREVLVLHDYTDSGLAIRRELENTLGRFSGISVRFVNDEPLAQTLEQVRAMPKDSLVVMLSYAVDQTGRTFTQADVARKVTDVSPVPVYGVHAEQLGHGVVGGRMLSGDIQGSKAAELVIRILKGESAGDMPVLTSNISSVMLDYQVATRYGLNLDAAPQDALVINRPLSTYAVNKTIFWLSALLTLFVTGVAITLFITIKRRKRLERILAQEVEEHKATGQTLLQERNNLEAEKERLAVTLSSIGDGVITTDTESRVVLINQVAQWLCGWSQEEAAGRALETVFRIVNETTRQPQNNPVNEVLATGKIMELANHTILISRDGSEHSIADSAAPIHNLAGTVIGVVLVFRDMTEKLKVEADLFKAHKLESIGVLAGGIAHDFNNYLTAILGNIALARSKVGTENKISELLEGAEIASMRAKGLTQQLLTFAKGGAPVRRLASIGQILTDSASFVLRGSNVRCVFSIAEDLCPVEVDIGQLTQVFNNLVINAAQAMPGGGQIAITASNTNGDGFEMLSNQGQRYVMITIEDHGIGITPEALARIFDPYFTTKEQGSGLGLAVVYSIIRNHMGEIRVTSKIGVGTTVTLLLPAADKAQESDATANATGSLHGSGRILVMDDEEYICEVLVRILKMLGYDTMACNNGLQAVQLYQEALQSNKRFDVVVMDITIPGGMGGKEAIEHLLALDPKVCAIVSSGYSNAPVMAQYREYGFKATLAKPYNIAEIGTVLKQVLAD